jgi:hypothetical protein
MRALIAIGIFTTLTLWAQQAQPPASNPVTGNSSAAKKQKTKTATPPVPFPRPPAAEPATTEQYDRAARMADKLRKEPAGVKGGTDEEPESILRNRRRYALIIANQDYRELEKLHSPRVDAEALVDVLASDGFIVQVFFDLDHQKFQETLDRFEQNLRPDDFAFFYYTGHAIEINGANFLLPVDFRKSDDRVPRSKGIPLETVRELFGRASRPRMLVVDACRTSPLEGGAKPTAGLLPEQSAQTHEALVFSTSENGNAFDGSGWSRSLFSRALTHALRQKEIGLKQAVQLAKMMVLIFSNAKQRPQVALNAAFDDVSLWPEGTTAELAHTDLRDYVGLDFARDSNIARRAKSGEHAKEPVGDAEHVLTLSGDWTAAPHTPITDWRIDRVDRAIAFLEEGLNSRSLSPQYKSVWDHIKGALGKTNTFWFCESLVFRKADLPAAIERLPANIAAEIEKNHASFSRSFASVRGMLGLLDAMTLEHMTYADLKKRLPPALLMLSDVSLEDDFYPANKYGIQTAGSWVTSQQVCSAVALNTQACDLKFHSLSSWLDKLDQADIRVVVFLLEMTMEYRVPVDWWLLPEGDAFVEWPKRLVAGLRRASLARLRQDPVLQACGDIFTKCDVVAADDDPLDPITAYSRSETFQTLAEADSNSWYNDKSSFDEADVSDQLYTGLLYHSFPVSAWGRRNQRSLEGIATSRGMQFYVSALADCRESLAWRALNEETALTRTKVEAVGYFEFQSLIAQNLFDLSSIRHYDKQLTELGDRDHGLACWNEILTGQPFSECNTLSLPSISTANQNLVWPHNGQSFENCWMRIFGLESSGDSKAADAELELAQQWSKITDAARISQTPDEVANRRQRLAAMEHLLAVMRGKATDTTEYAPTLIPDLRVSSKCGVPPEIR